MSLHFCSYDKLFSHSRMAKAQASLHIWAVMPETFLTYLNGESAEPAHLGSYARNVSHIPEWRQSAEPAHLGSHARNVSHIPNGDSQLSLHIWAVMPETFLTYPNGEDQVSLHIWAVMPKTFLR